jgi:DNA-binding IclR family transcriptional regulator
MKQEKTPLKRSRAPASQPAPGGDEAAAHSAAGRALAVLQLVGATDGAVSAVDLYPALKFPKPTIHRLMLQLEALGFLEREPGSKRFIAGQALTRMSVTTLINSPARGIRHAILQSVVDEVQETCNITTLAGSEIVYIDRVEAHWPLRYHLQPGSRVPIHCSASGRLFLSFMPARKRRLLLGAVPLKSYTSKTVTDPVRIDALLKQVRADEVSLDFEEFMDGLVGIAVPVFDRRGRICATVSMHAPSLRCSAEHALAVVPALKRAAQAITRNLAEIAGD